MAHNHPGPCRESIMTSGSLTVLFEEPFWIGLFEFSDEDGLHVCKVTFGAEPTVQEVLEFVEKNHHHLKYSDPVPDDTKAKSPNPKRLLRQAKKTMSSSGIGTKSQQALKAQQEKAKAEHKTESKERKEEARQRKFELAQIKRKEKHKGH